MSRPGFRKDPGLFVSCGSSGLPNLCPTGAHRGAMHPGPLFNNLPRDALRLLAPASRTQADIAQLAERDHAMVEASGSNPGIRSRHLMAGVLRHNGHACAPQSAGRPGCAPRGRPRRAARQRFGGLEPPSRWSTTAMGFHGHQQQAFVELTLRGRKSAATIGRHRNPSPESLGGVAQGFLGAAKIA